MTFRDFTETPLRSFIHTPEIRSQGRALYRNGAKRCLDVLLVLLSLPVSLPLVLGMMLLVVLDGGRPLYRQKRLGRDGRVFDLVKIRTMVPGADGLLENHLQEHPEARREWDETQKLKRDPRTTRVGRFLRRSSLDELPQLWNVLRGEMSLVGPRPILLEQQAIYPGGDYFTLRPGITGPWQISDRNEISFAERAAFDSDYLATLSLSRDLSILCRTVLVVARGTGY